jgi:hypothetical protein
VKSALINGGGGGGAFGFVLARALLRAGFEQQISARLARPNI